MRTDLCRRKAVQSTLIGRFVIGLAVLCSSTAWSQDAAPVVAADDAPPMPAALMLDPTDKVWSLQVTSKSRLTVEKGDIVVNSINKGALWIADGNIDALDGAILCAGGITNLGKTSPKPYPVIGAAPVEDPIGEFRIPPPEREISREGLWLNYQPEVTLPPGIYTGGIRIVGKDSVVTLQPGVYVMNGGDFFVSGSLVQGKDVTIVMAGEKPGRFWTAGGARLDLSAPTTGPLQNLLMVSRAEGWNMLQIDDTKGFFKGLVYAPAAGVGVSAGSELSFDRIICANLGLALASKVHITGKSTPLNIDELDKAAAPPVAELPQ